MGRWHAHELSRAGGRVVAVVDRDHAAAGALASRHRPARALTRLADALSKERPDVVHICTPSDSHVGLSEQAILAGAHVLVEKPLAPDADAVERLLDTAGQNGVLVCPTHQFLFQRGVERARRVFPSVSPLVHAEMTICSAGGGARNGDRREQAVWEILPHPLSVLHRLLPNGLLATRWDVFHAGEGELRLSGQGASHTVSVIVSMTGRPTRNELHLTGARGTIHIDFFHGFAMLESGATSRARKIARPFVHSSLEFQAAAANLARRLVALQPAYPGLRELIASFYAAVDRGRPSPIPASETLLVARLGERLRTGRG